MKKNFTLFGGGTDLKGPFDLKSFLGSLPTFPFEYCNSFDSGLIMRIVSSGGVKYPSVANGIIFRNSSLFI